MINLKMTNLSWYGNVVLLIKDHPSTALIVYCPHYLQKYQQNISTLTPSLTTLFFAIIIVGLEFVHKTAPRSGLR